MLKKNSWILALLLAFSLAAFFIVGCVDPLKVVEDTETYEEYPLDKGYNAWAGQVYQKGWATGGIVFQGKGDALVTAKDLGYDIEMFQKATKLKIEMPDASYPRSGVDIIWGGEDASGDSTKAGGMWNQQPIAGGSGDVDTTYAKKDGNVLIIDLTKALKNYSAYTKAAKLKIVLQVNAPSYGDVEGLVQKAYLMIPNTPPPYRPISTFQLAKEEMYWTSDFELVPRIKPDNATNQAVIWAIQKWWPEGEVEDGPNTIKLPAVTPSIPASVSAYNAAKTELLKKINWKQEEYVYDVNVYPNEYRLRDVVGTLAVPEASGEDSLGTVKIKGVVKDGIEKKTGGYADKTMTFSVLIKDPPLFAYKIGGTLVNGVLTGGTYYATKFWGAIDNGGVSGGEMEVITTTTPVVVGSDNAYTSYTGLYSPTGGQYANSIQYIVVKFPAGKTLDSYRQITCHYKSTNCDLIGKSVRVKAMVKKPDRTYNPGPYIATISFPGGTEAKDVDLVFDLYKDNANEADGTTKKGIYDAGVGADLSKSTTNAENAERFESEDKEGNIVNVKDANEIYLWFLPWGDVGTKYTISDLNFVPK